MGSFNLKCSISNKTIEYGDKVAVIVLNENEFRGNLKDSILIYYNDKYQFKTLPIFGTYNDYGGVEDIEESHGLRDILEDIGISNKEEFSKGIKLSPIQKMERDEKISKLLEKNPLMHIKREVYDYLMSDEFNELMVEEEYGDNIEYHKEESLSENKESIRNVYDKWMGHKKRSEDDSLGISDRISLQSQLREFSRMDSSTYLLLVKNKVALPRSLVLFNNAMGYKVFKEYNNGNFDEYFDKLVNLDRLNKIFRILGIRLFPTLYGSQSNDGDKLWDKVYENIPKTKEDEEY